MPENGLHELYHQANILSELKKKREAALKVTQELNKLSALSRELVEFAETKCSAEAVSNPPNYEALCLKERLSRITVVPSGLNDINHDELMARLNRLHEACRQNPSFPPDFTQKTEQLCRSISEIYENRLRCDALVEVNQDLQELLNGCLSHLARPSSPCDSNSL